MKLTNTKMVILKSEWHRNQCENGLGPHFQQIIADRTGIAKTHVSATLNGNIISKTYQEKISNETDIPVARLFGRYAWFKKASKRLRKLESLQLAANTN